MRVQVHANGDPIWFGEHMNTRCFPSSVWVPPLEGFTAPGYNFLRIVKRQSRTAIKLSTDLPLVRLVLYSANGVLCPEPFVKFTLKPGEAKTWITTYKFQTDL